MRFQPWNLHPLNCRLRLSDFAALRQEDQQQYSNNDVVLCCASEAAITQWPLRAALRPLGQLHLGEKLCTARASQAGEKAICHVSYMFSSPLYLTGRDIVVQGAIAAPSHHQSKAGSSYKCTNSTLKALQLPF